MTKRKLEERILDLEAKVAKLEEEINMLRNAVFHSNRQPIRDYRDEPRWYYRSEKWK